MTAAPNTRSVIVVHHATRHDVDQFRLAHVGTGEGNQTFGFGLYFAENPQVAQNYREWLGGRKAFDRLLLNGKPVVTSDDAGRTARAQRDLLRSMDGKLVSPDAEVAMLAEQAVTMPLVGNGSVQRAIEALGDDPKLSAVVAWLETHKKRLSIQPEEFHGNTYTAELDFDGRGVLDWDAPVTRQDPVAFEAIRRSPAWGQINQDHQTKSLTWNGSDVYEYMVRQQEAKGASRQDAPRLASEELLRLGVGGIRYLDNGSRALCGGEVLGIDQVAEGFRAKVKVVNRAGTGFSAKTDSITTSRPFPTWQEAEHWARERTQSGTRNYVVFDERVIRITHQNGKGLSAKVQARALEDIHRDTDATGVARPQAVGWPALTQPADAVRQVVVHHGTGHDIEVFAKGMEHAIDKPFAELPCRGIAVSTCPYVADYRRKDRNQAQGYHGVFYKIDGVAAEEAGWPVNHPVLYAAQQGEQGLDRFIETWRQHRQFHAQNPVAVKLADDYTKDAEGLRGKKVEVDRLAGNVYTATLELRGPVLDLESRLCYQDPGVRTVIERWIFPIPEQMTGAGAVKQIGKAVGSAKTMEALRKAGVIALSYPGGPPSADSRPLKYLVLAPECLEITHQNGQPVESRTQVQRQEAVDKVMAGYGFAEARQTGDLFEENEHLGSAPTLS